LKIDTPLRTINLAWIGTAHRTQSSSAAACTPASVALTLDRVLHRKMHQAPGRRFLVKRGLDVV